MRFMMIVLANPESETGQLPDEKALAAMADYNEQLVKAGVLLAAEGLHPSSRGARVRFSGNERKVIDGPFTESKELVAGYWLIKAASRDEALEWARRIPFDEGEVEVREVHELSDFPEGDALRHHRDIAERLPK
jgi:hypothetical protein